MTHPIHIMLDLETWGKRPGCDIRSIGACVFDPDTGRVCDNAQPYTSDPDGKTDGSFYIATDNPSGISRSAMGDEVADKDGRVFISLEDNPDRDKYRRYPLTRDPETVQWWSEQSAEAQAAFADPVDLRLALERFTNWLWSLLPVISPMVEPPVDLKPLRLWSHGPQFDISILEAAYHAVGLPVPWHYRAPRDTRTAFDMAGVADHKEWLTQFNTGTSHHALDDAIAQARAVCAAFARNRQAHERLRECVTGWRIGRDIAGPMWKGKDWLEDRCPGHVAHADDNRICYHCGTHIDEMRPDDDDFEHGGL